jgi:hypothetical protein
MEPILRIEDLKTPHRTRYSAPFLGNISQRPRDGDADDTSSILTGLQSIIGAFPSKLNLVDVECKDILEIQRSLDFCNFDVVCSDWE